MTLSLFCSAYFETSEIRRKDIHRIPQVHHRVFRLWSDEPHRLWVEGDLLSSLFEGPGPASINSNQPTVPVQLKKSDGQLTLWTDTLVLRQDDGG